MYPILSLGLISVLFVALAYLAFVLAGLKRKHTELEARLIDFDKQLDNRDAKMTHVTQVLGELQSQQIQQATAMSQVQQVCDLQQTLTADLQNKIQLLESQNDENKMYQRAKKLFELGADIDEVMTECGLSKSEAELLLSLSQQASNT